MKTLLYATLSALTLGVASCQESRTVKVKVIEENGKPIKDVRVIVTFLGYTGEQTQRIEGVTDITGGFSAQGKPPLRMGVRLEKKGYYTTTSGRLSRTKDHKVSYVLRKIKNPIPLYAKKTRIIAPVLEKNLAYDFMVGDWVIPYGRGKHEDIFFKVSHNKINRRDYKYQLEVTFPNDLDGIQEFFDNRLSDLKSKHQAPEKGYKPSWLQKVERKPSVGRTGNRNPNRNYWLRIRSKKNTAGKLISAHDVKIYGDFPELD